MFVSWWNNFLDTGRIMANVCQSLRYQDDPDFSDLGETEIATSGHLLHVLLNDVKWCDKSNGI